MSENGRIQRVSDGFWFLLQLLKYCRISVFVIVAGGILLFLTDQGKELTVSLADTWIKRVYFVVAVTIWAWVSWYWSRRILLAREPALKKASLRMAEDRGERVNDESLSPFGDWAFAHVPRLIGLIGFGVAVGSSLITGLKYTAIVCVILGIASYIYWTMRWYEHVADETTKRWYARPISYVLFLLLLSVPWAIWEPVSMGFTLGAATVVFLGLATIAVVGNFIVLKTHKYGLPIITLMLILGGILSGLGWNDNHKIRIAEDEGDPIPFEGRKTLEKALEKWLLINTATPTDTTWWLNKDETAKPTKRPLVLVATAGGGLRAAYWTVTVLGAAQDIEPDFRNALFAMSGVSGGSLGATVFNAVLVEELPADCRSEWTLRNGEDRPTQTCFEATAQEILSYDFLGPTVAALMYPDLVQKFVFPAFLPSRATALETSWEGAWDRTYPENPGRLARPFLALWKLAKDSWLPALFLNGTHQESGKRIIASNLQVTPDIFIDVADIYSDSEDGKPMFLDGDMPASTAAHNSARFSYVSPAGTLKTGGHVIDGGYFENYGAQTLIELLESIHEELETEEGTERPIVLVQISNDTDLADRLTLNHPAGSSENATFFSQHSEKDLNSIGIREASSTFNEVTAPVVGLLNTRTARGVLAAKDLGDWARWLREHDRPAIYLHFRLSKEESESLALGWVLSNNSVLSMQKQLRSELNLKNLAKLLCALGTDSTTIDEALPKAVSGGCESLGEPPTTTAPAPYLR